MACKINQEIEIETVRQLFKKPIKIKLKNASKFFTWSLKENGFYNQVTIEYRDGTSKKSIKIFPNGTVHVTGCSDIDDCHKVMHQIQCVLQKLVNVNIRIGNFQIFMINTNFSMNYTLNLQTVINILRTKGYNISFNPEVYSAVKVKFQPDPHMKQITASIFSSGCILITGAVNLKEITASYSILVNCLTEARMTPTKEVMKFDIFMGRTFDYWKKTIGNI
jgi:TATA-box binding protein (TBP) (component of TFIID and TFIIIB)